MREVDGVQCYWIALDLETSGTLPEYALQPWRFHQRDELGRRKAWITTAAYSMWALDGTMVSRGKTYPRKADLAQILEMAIKFNAYVVVWNGVFDIAWLTAVGLGELCMKVKWLDAMRLWKHLDISSSFSTADHTYRLKGERGAAGMFLPASVGREDDVDYHSTDPAELRKLLSYNKDDTADTLRVAEVVWDRLEPKRRAAFLLECACLPMVAAANVEGMCISKPTVKAVDARMVKQAAEMEAELGPQGVTEKVIASPQQLAALIYGTWGLPILKRGKPNDKWPEGVPSTDKDTLTELVILDERAAKLRLFREALGLRSKFVGGIVKSVVYNEDNRTRPQAVVFGTYTGRFTYNSTQNKKADSEDLQKKKATGKQKLQIGFALHQMKRDKQFKSMIVAPEDHDLVEFDAAGQEFRWMAIHSLDETMLMLCQPGEDAHSYMGAQIAGLDYYELRDRVRAAEEAATKIRQGGKVGNLSLQYRTSPKTFRIRSRTDHNLIISAHEADKICKTYVRSYPGVPKYWAKQIAKGRQLGYAETLAGRRVQVKGHWQGPQQWAMESTMINYPIQGTGGDQKYLAMAILKDRINEFDARFAWDLHDGLYWYVPKSKSMKFAVEMRDVLAALPYRKAWGFDSPIPLPWDAKTGPSWGALKDIEA